MAHRDKRESRQGPNSGDLGLEENDWRTEGALNLAKAENRKLVQDNLEDRGTEETSGNGNKKGASALSDESGETLGEGESEDILYLGTTQGEPSTDDQPSNSSQGCKSPTGKGGPFKRSRLS